MMVAFRSALALAAVSLVGCSIGSGESAAGGAAGYDVNAEHRRRRAATKYFVYDGEELHGAESSQCKVIDGKPCVNPRAMALAAGTHTQPYPRGENLDVLPQQDWEELPDKYLAHDSTKPPQYGLPAGEGQVLVTRRAPTAAVALTGDELERMFNRFDHTGSVIIDDSNYQALAKDRAVFLLISSPACPYCQAAEPAWTEFVRRVNKDSELPKKVMMAKAEPQWWNQDLFQGRGYPTFVFLKPPNGRFFADGPRTAEAWMSHLKKHL